MKQTFSELEYRRPDVPAVLDTYRRLIAEAEAAADGAALVQVYREHDAADRAWGFASSLCSIRHTLDTTDPFYDGENEFFDRNTPAVGNIQLELYRALLASPHRAALAEEFGGILLQNIRIHTAAVIAAHDAPNQPVIFHDGLFTGIPVSFLRGPQ